MKKSSAYVSHRSGQIVHSPRANVHCGWSTKEQIIQEAKHPVLEAQSPDTNWQSEETSQYLQNIQRVIATSCSDEKSEQLVSFHQISGNIKIIAKVNDINDNLKVSASSRLAH